MSLHFGNFQNHKLQSHVRSEQKFIIMIIVMLYLYSWRIINIYVVQSV
jgi:hypothetical protein